MPFSTHPSTTPWEKPGWSRCQSSTPFQVIDGEVKEYWAQYRALGDTIIDRPPP